MAERALTEHERLLLDHITKVDWPDAQALNESVAHLVVTGGCGCGCASINVRDVRFPEQRHELEHWCNAVSADGAEAVVLWLGSDRRIAALDVELPDDGRLPDPSNLIVTSPYDLDVSQAGPADE